MTEADLIVIETAIASGTLRVKFADREVQYQTTADLLKAREAIRKALGKSRIHSVTVNYSKGLDYVDGTIDGANRHTPWSRR